MTKADNAKTCLLWNKYYYYPDISSQNRISSKKAMLKKICHKAGLSGFSLFYIDKTSLMLSTVISDHKGYIQALKLISKWTYFYFFHKT